MKRNSLLSHLSEKYLFHDVKMKVEAFQARRPDATILSLGIGDTTQPLAQPIAQTVQHLGKQLGMQEGYKGYGPELGLIELREALSNVIYGHTPHISYHDIFISDGAKCDIGRLQLLFGNAATCIAIQDPTYPVYFDSSLFVRDTRVTRLTYLPSSTQDPYLDLASLPNGSLIFLCSPNNPTGTVFTRDEVATYVEIAKKKEHIIIFDVAYREYASDDALKSIYEIPDAEKVAIEIGSFSKSCGFSGIRLGWTVVPSSLVYSGTQDKIQKDFIRMMTTLFNGASYISQKAGLCALSPEGRAATQKQISLYKSNTNILKSAFTASGCTVFGGEHAPYIWVSTKYSKSWDAFDYFLEKACIVTTPGIGFGPAGEGYLRVSGFASTDTILKARQRLLQLRLL